MDASNMLMRRGVSWDCRRRTVSGKLQLLLNEIIEFKKCIKENLPFLSFLFLFVLYQHYEIFIQSLFRLVCSFRMNNALIVILEAYLGSCNGICFGNSIKVQMALDCEGQITSQNNLSNFKITRFYGTKKSVRLKNRLH